MACFQMPPGLHAKKYVKCLTGAAVDDDDPHRHSGMRAAGGCNVTSTAFPALLPEIR